jgi:putative (di)nucleoside polyphosphate hydrolase
MGQVGGQPRPAFGSDHGGRIEGQAKLKQKSEIGNQKTWCATTEIIAFWVLTSDFRLPMSFESMSFESLPYRPCVGIVVLNRAGLAFIGRRIDGPEHVDLTHAWQMPQGGIDAGEQPWPAALRELREETNITSVEHLGEIDGWLNYDIPRQLVGEAWSGKYRGQTQKWFAVRFLGAVSEIDIAHPAGAHEAEFSDWRWEPLQNVPELVVPFKRQVYERVVKEFMRFAPA